MMAGPAVTEFEVTTQEVQSFDDLGYARGTYYVALEMEEGADPVRLDGKFLTVFQRQPDGTWLIYRDIFNFDS